MPQTSFGQPVMPQSTYGMPYPRLNTIWNLSQQSILVSSQVPLYQPGHALEQPMQQLPFEGISSQIQSIVQVTSSTPAQQSLQQCTQSTHQTLGYSPMATSIQNPGSSSPRTLILGVSQIIVLPMSHATMQPCVQSLPRAYGV